MYASFFKLAKSTARKKGLLGPLDGRCMIDDHDTNFKHLLVKSEDPDRAHHPRQVTSHSHQ